MCSQSGQDVVNVGRPSWCLGELDIRFVDGQELPSPAHISLWSVPQPRLAILTRPQNGLALPSQCDKYCEGLIIFH